MCILPLLSPVPFLSSHYFRYPILIFFISYVFLNRCNNKDNLTFTIGLLFCSIVLCFRVLFLNNVSIDTFLSFSSFFFKYITTDFTQQSNCIIAIKNKKPDHFPNVYFFRLSFFLYA